MHPKMHIDLMGEIDNNTIIVIVKIPHFQPWIEHTDRKSLKKSGITIP